VSRPSARRRFLSVPKRNNARVNQENTYCVRLCSAGFGRTRLRSNTIARAAEFEAESGAVFIRTTQRNNPAAGWCTTCPFERAALNSRRG